jgi:hypothetical protein
MESSSGNADWVGDEKEVNQIVGTSCDAVSQISKLSYKAGKSPIQEEDNEKQVV